MTHVYCQERETNIHIFVDCPIAKNFWQKIEPILQSVTNKKVCTGQSFIISVSCLISVEI